MNNDGSSVVERMSTSLAASVVWQRTTLTYLTLPGTEWVGLFYGALQGGWMVETKRYYVYGGME
jgi:hypothetical protein